MKTNDEIRRDNLLLAVTRFGTATALANAAGVAAAYLSQIKTQAVEKKTGKPKAMGDEVARKIEEALGEPVGWMDVQHISADADLSKNQQVSGMITRLTQGPSHTMGEAKEPFDANVEPVEAAWHRVPLISFVQAGMMTEAVDPFSLGDGFEIVLTHIPVSPRTFALRIKGDSMWPEYTPGDVVIIDPEVSPQPGDMVVAKNTEDEATFKKYRPRGTNDRGDMIFELVPLNDDYPTLNSERDHLHVIGVEIEHRKYRRPR